MRNKITPEAPEKSYLQKYGKEQLGKSAVMVGASFSKALTGSVASNGPANFQNSSNLQVKKEQVKLGN